MVIVKVSAYLASIRALVCQRIFLWEVVLWVNVPMVLCMMSHVVHYVGNCSRRKFGTAWAVFKGR